MKDQLRTRLWGVLLTLSSLAALALATGAGKRWW